MHDMMSLELAKQHRNEILREVRSDCLVKALRAGRRRREGKDSALVWEIKRYAGIILKVLRRIF